MRNCLNSIGFHVKPSAVLRLALRHTLAVALAALAILSTIMPVPAFAADSEQQVKTVRVGWLVNNKGFQEGTPGERLSGWGYEYLQTLSYYTKGWQYEYVSGTFTELMDMLEAGEIDLMPNISYSEERAQKLLFSSNPEGAERYNLEILGQLPINPPLAEACDKGEVETALPDGMLPQAVSAVEAIAPHETDEA